MVASWLADDDAAGGAWRGVCARVARVDPDGFTWTLRMGGSSTGLLLYVWSGSCGKVVS